MLRVLMVSARFYPVIGGAEQQAYKLAKALTANGISVNVVTGQSKSLAPVHDQLGSIPVTRLFAYDAYLLGLMSWLWLHRNQYDLIHVHQIVYPAWAAGRIGSWLKKPVIAKAGNSGPGFDLRYIRALPIVGNAMARAIPTLLDRAIAISEAVVHDLETAGFRDDQIVRIPNGVELPAPAAPEVRSDARKRLQIQYHEPIVVYVGRLHPNKNLPMLLEAAAILKQKELGFHLYIVGDGSEFETLTATVKNENLADVVHLVGASDQVAVWLQAADVFVLSSLTEGMSNALLEAAAYGLPVVVTDVGGNKDMVIEGVNGYRVPLHDVKQFASALEGLLRDSDLRQKMGMSGRNLVESRYDITYVAAQYIALYKELLNRSCHKKN
jgi:glycosyltransferase involved in cell wall biosynthesis